MCTSLNGNSTVFGLMRLMMKILVKAAVLSKALLYRIVLILVVQISKNLSEEKNQL